LDICTPQVFFWVTDGLQMYQNPCAVLLRYVEWILWQLIKVLQACLALLSYPTKHVPETFLWFEGPPCCVNQSCPVISWAYNYFVLLAVCSAICSVKFGFFCQAEHMNG
jgi:hypothetical protein